METEPAAPKSSKGPLLAGALGFLLAAAIGAGAWLMASRAPAPPPPQPAPPPAGAEPAPPAVAPPPVPASELAALLQSISSNALYRSWIAEPDPIHRWAVVADNLQEDVSPRAQLGFLKPEQPFAVVEGKSGATASPAAFARYDALGDAIASIDAAAFARVVRALHPALQWTYRELGYPKASLDVVAAQALSRLGAAPLPGSAPTLVKRGASWIYADPQLEGLGPVEKHLLRLGPRNARLVREKARELLTSLGLPEVKVAPR